MIATKVCIMFHLQDGQQKLLWHLSSLPLSGSCYSCASMQMGFTCFSSFSTAWSCTELQSRETLGAGTLLNTEWEAPVSSLQCDTLHTHLVCLSHLGFAQLLEETDLDKMTHLLLSTLEYLVRILDFSSIWSSSPMAEEHLCNWNWVLLSAWCLSISLPAWLAPPEYCPVFNCSLHCSLIIRRTFTAGPGSLWATIPWISCGDVHTHLFF